MSELPSSTQREIADQLERTNKLIERLQSQRYLTMIDHPMKFLCFSFLHGIAVSLGYTVGIVVVLGGIIYLLQALGTFTPLKEQIQSIQDFLERLQDTRLPTR